MAPELMEEAQHVQLCPLFHNAAAGHSELVNAAQLDRPASCGNACEAAPGFLSVRLQDWLHARIDFVAYRY